MPSCPSDIDQLDRKITSPPDSVVSMIAGVRGDFMVLGAGGKMGFHLSRMLQRGLQAAGRTDPVTVVSRFSDQASKHKFESYGFRVIEADLCDSSRLADLPDTENVFYLAGMKFGTSGNPELLQKMNVDLPGSVADRFRASRIVALSTGCVYSFSSPESGGSRETDATDPPGEYALSCLGRERAFQASSAEHGTRCTLVRLNYSVDLRYGVLVDLARQILDGQPIDLQTGYVNLIWQGDAVAQILQCLPLCQSPPFVINLTGDETYRVRELARMLAARLDREVSFVGREAETAWLSNNARARREFGSPRTAIEQVIDWTAQWLLAGRSTLNKPTHFQTRSGNY